ncbi:MAG: hypothetical protein QXJ06_00415 [Candidatus Aenigmatarchaeota archaeon]
MKGEAENTIVRIIIALIILGVVVTLLYLGIGPFRETVEYNICKARIEEYCATKGTGTPIVGIDCIEKVNRNLKGKEPLKLIC